MKRGAIIEVTRELLHSQAGVPFAADVNNWKGAPLAIVHMGLGLPPAVQLTGAFVDEAAFRSDVVLLKLNGGCLPSVAEGAEYPRLTVAQVLQMHAVAPADCRVSQDELWRKYTAVGDSLGAINGKPITGILSANFSHGFGEMGLEPLKIIDDHEQDEPTERETWRDRPSQL